MTTVWELSHVGLYKLKREQAADTPNQPDLQVRHIGGGEGIVFVPGYTAPLQRLYIYLKKKLQGTQHVNSTDYGVILKSGFGEEVKDWITRVHKGIDILPYQT